MKRLVTLILYLTGFFIPINAEDIYYFVIWTTDDAKISYEFKHHPKVIPNNDVLILSTIHTTVEYQASQIHKFTLEKTTVNTVDVNTNKRKNDILRNDDILTIQGHLGENIEIYSIGGVLMDTKKINDDKFQISLSNYASGIYIIRINKLTIKFIKK